MLNSHNRSIFNLGLLLALFFSTTAAQATLQETLDAFRPHANRSSQFTEALLGDRPPVSTKQNEAEPNSRDSCLYYTRNQLITAVQLAESMPGLFPENLIDPAWVYPVASCLSRYGLCSEWRTVSGFYLLYSDITSQFDIYNATCIQKNIGPGYDRKIENHTFFFIFPKGYSVQFRLKELVERQGFSVFDDAVVFDPMTNELYAFKNRKRKGKRPAKALHSYLAQSESMCLEASYKLIALSRDEIRLQIQSYNIKAEALLSVLFKESRYGYVTTAQSWDEKGLPGVNHQGALPCIRAYRKMLGVNGPVASFKPYLRMGADGYAESVAEKP